jgi:spore maturation protein CgeB
MAKIFSAAGIVLNFIRPQNGQSHNMRSFEAPACGGFMLATRTRQQMEWLPEGQAAAYFSTPEEMRAQTSAYLHSPAEREALAQEGLKRVTEGRHTYADRVAQIMETVGQL